MKQVPKKDEVITIEKERTAIGWKLRQTEGNSHRATVLGGHTSVCRNLVT